MKTTFYIVHEAHLYRVRLDLGEIEYTEIV